MEDNKYILINHHSFVDVITNSSTELFVCDTDKTIEMVEEIIQSIVDSTGFGTIGDFTVRKYTKEDFDQHDSEWSYGYEKECNIGKIIIEGSSDNSIPYELFDILEHKFEADSYHLG